MTNISEWRMRIYFSRSATSWIIILIISALSIIVSIYFKITVLLLLACALFVVSIIVHLFRLLLKPSDQEYDKWLDGQFTNLYSSVLQKLHLHPSQVISSPLHLHGFVWPGTEDARSYSDVRVKEGRDRYSRFSVNVYTFFVATQQHIAIFVSDINALDQSTHVENAYYYYYDHVVGVVTRDVQVEIKVRGRTYGVLLQNFALQVTNGESVKVGAALRAKPIGRNKNVPALTTTDSEIGMVTAALLMLLRDHKRRP